MYALILSGGRGERLRPLTDNLPKPMVPVGGKPILQRQAEWLVEAGVTDIVFPLLDTAGKRYATTSRMAKPTASALTTASKILLWVVAVPSVRACQICPYGEGPLIVTNGDIVTDLPLSDLLAGYNQATGANPDHMATITVVPFRSPYGIVDLNDSDGVTGFREKVELPFWINAGIYVMRRDIEPLLPALGDHEVETFPALAEQGRLSALRYRGYWTSVRLLQGPTGGRAAHDRCVT